MVDYCSHCFHEFVSFRAWFRCTNYTCSGRKVDEVYNKWHNIASPVLTGMAIRPSRPDIALGVLGGIRKVKCPQCSILTTVRICPICHDELAEDGANVPHKVIALFGSSQSGKTCYLASALREFPNALNRFEYSGSVSGDRSRDLERKLLPLFTENLLPTRTPEQQTKPIEFRLTASNLAPCAMDIFDCGGEAVRSRSQIQFNVKQARIAKGFAFMIDPFQLEGLRKQLQALGVALPPYQYDALPSSTLNRLIESFEGWGMSPGGMIQAPFAFVVSKLDVWRETIDPKESVRRPSSAIKSTSSNFNSAQLDYSTLENESSTIKNKLREWDLGLSTLIEQRFERYMFFAVSALGASPVGGNMTVPVVPNRVELPLLWLANETEIISI